MSWPQSLAKKITIASLPLMDENQPQVGVMFLSPPSL